MEIYVWINVIILNPNQFSLTSTPTDFQTGKITYTEISSVGSVGLPNNAPGTLITYKVSRDVNYCYQEYKFRNSEKKYTRSYVGTSWSTWRLSQIGSSSVTQSITVTIQVGETFVHNFEYLNVKKYDVINVSPVVFESDLYALVINGTMNRVDSASIVLTNLSQKIINLNNKAFVCRRYWKLIRLTKSYSNNSK